MTSESTVKKLKKEIKDLNKEIEELKESEESLRDSERKFKAIFEYANDEIIYTSLNGTILDVNPKVEDIFGYKPEEIIGKKYTDGKNIFPKKTMKTIVDLTTEAFSSHEGNATFQLDVFHRDGTPVTIEANSRLIEREGELTGVLTIIRDITRRKVAEEMLMKIQGELKQMVKERTANLEEANTALKVLLKSREGDRKELEQKMLLNVKELIEPFLDKLKGTKLNNKQRSFIKIIEANLDNIVSPFAREMSSRYLKLTPAELQIAELIKQGNSSKDIADLLNMSSKTIDTHRYNIRKKIGLTNKKANLRTYLQSLK